MKIAKITKEEEQKVSRKVISKFGEAIYHCPEVSSVLLKLILRTAAALVLDEMRAKMILKDYLSLRMMRRFRFL